MSRINTDFVIVEFVCILAFVWNVKFAQTTDTSSYLTGMVGGILLFVAVDMLWELYRTEK